MPSQGLYSNERRKQVNKIYACQMIESTVEGKGDRPFQGWRRLQL
jgi:hypothetical protein